MHHYCTNATPMIHTTHQSHRKSTQTHLLAPHHQIMPGPTDHPSYLITYTQPLLLYCHPMMTIINTIALKNLTQQPIMLPNFKFSMHASRNSKKATNNLSNNFKQCNKHNQTSWSCLLNCWSIPMKTYLAFKHVTNIMKHNWKNSKTLSACYFVQRSLPL